MNIKKKDRVRRLKLLNISTGELAKKVGMTIGTVQCWLDNTASFRSVALIEKALGQRENELIEKRKKLGIQIDTLYTFFNRKVT